MSTHIFGINVHDEFITSQIRNNELNKFQSNEIIQHVFIAISLRGISEKVQFECVIWISFL